MKVRVRVRVGVIVRERARARFCHFQVFLHICDVPQKMIKTISVLAVRV